MGATGPGAVQQTQPTATVETPAVDADVPTDTTTTPDPFDNSDAKGGDDTVNIGETEPTTETPTHATTTPITITEEPDTPTEPTVTVTETVTEPGTTVTETVTEPAVTVTETVTVTEPGTTVTETVTQTVTQTVTEPAATTPSENTPEETPEETPIESTPVASTPKASTPAVSPVVAVAKAASAPESESVSVKTTKKSSKTSDKLSTATESENTEEQNFFQGLMNIAYEKFHFPVDKLAKVYGWTDRLHKWGYDIPGYEGPADDYGGPYKADDYTKSTEDAYSDRAYEEVMNSSEDSKLTESTATLDDSAYASLSYPAYDGSSETVSGSDMYATLSSKLDAMYSNSSYTDSDLSSTTSSGIPDSVKQSRSATYASQQKAFQTWYASLSDSQKAGVAQMTSNWAASKEDISTSEAADIVDTHTMDDSSEYARNKAKAAEEALESGNDTAANEKILDTQTDTMTEAVKSEVSANVNDFTDKLGIDSSSFTSSMNEAITDSSTDTTSTDTKRFKADHDASSEVTSSDSKTTSTRSNSVDTDLGIDLSGYHGCGDDLAALENRANATNSSVKLEAQAIVGADNKSVAATHSADIENTGSDSSGVTQDYQDMSDNGEDDYGG